MKQLHYRDQAEYRAAQVQGNLVTAGDVAGHGFVSMIDTAALPPELPGAKAGPLSTGSHVGHRERRGKEGTCRNVEC